MPDWNAIQAFMANVVPWPSSPQDDGWVNLHFSFPDTKNPKLLVKKGGWPIKTIDSFISRTSFALTTPARYKDIWYCTSLQRVAGTNTKGKPKAERKKINAMSLKSIWIDIDVDDDPKHYHTVEEALRACSLVVASTSTGSTRTRSPRRSGTPTPMA
jgi:hypothetical protein